MTLSSFSPTLRLTSAFIVFFIATVQPNRISWKQREKVVLFGSITCNKFRHFLGPKHSSHLSPVPDSSATESAHVRRSAACPDACVLGAWVGMVLVTALRGEAS